MKPDIEPLSPDLEQLLRAEKDFPEPPADVKEAVLAKFQATIQGSGGSGGEGGSSSGPSSSPNAGTGALQTLVANRIVSSAVIFALGTATGAGLHAALSGERPPPVAPAPPSAVAQQPPPPPVEPPSPPQPGVEPIPLKVPRVAQPEPAKMTANKLSPATALAAEHALVERSRNALARREAQLALDALSRHGREFPNGQLAEERDALWVQALVLAGQGAQARDKAAEFKRKHPASMLQPAVDAVLEQAP